jgi:hypothetical protein
LEIANHPTLFRFVHQVAISSESISGMTDFSLQSKDRLVDLQTSMEKSGLDFLVLSAAFRKLKNLRIVQIDEDSFCRASHLYDAVRCGRRYIMEDDTSVSNVEINQCCAFSIIFASLKDSGIAEQITLHIQTILTTDYNHYTKFFDPTSAEWEHSFSGNVINVVLFGKVTSHWALDLLLLSRNLQSLQLFNCSDIINFRHPTSGLFMWIYLRLLQLDNCACRNDTLVRFLQFHKDTLTQIYMSDINLISGSWRQPLQTMETMSKLEEMCLGSLYETTRPSKDGLSFDHFYDREEQDYEASPLRTL